jgi:N-acyl-D-amino-acid deacylase
MHDIVIRGGTILDGTGFEAFAGDLAIDGDRIVAVGGKLGPGRRDIDANGLLVTPGWVDVHTHYDGQATWDPVLAPSSWHGSRRSCLAIAASALRRFVSNTAPVSSI